MNYVKNNYVPFIMGGIIFLLVGVIIGLLYNNNKKEVLKQENTKTVDSANTNIKEKNNEEEKETLKETDQVSKKTNTTDNKTTTSSNVEKKTQEVMQKTEENITYSDKDKDVINTLSDTLGEVQKATPGENFTKNAKSTFINIVDFLFYDGTIKGVTFKELTDQGKQKVLELAHSIDIKIEEKAPGYKDSIKSGTGVAFNKASEVIKNGANNLNNFAKDKLGDENYQLIIDAKDELLTYTKSAAGFVSDVGSSLFSSAKDKLNKWYQKFKNS